MYSVKLFIAAILAFTVHASATPPVLTCATVNCAGTAPHCCDGPKGPRCVTFQEGQTCADVYDQGLLEPRCCDRAGCPRCG